MHASPEAVWRVVADVTRVGEWSGECRRCAWVAGATGPSPGARFRGLNRRGGLRWSRLNEVIRAEPPTLLVWRTLPRAPYPDSVQWELSIEPAGEGVVVTEAFRVLRIPRVMELLVGLALPAHRDRTADLAEDLERLRAVVEAPDAPRR